MMTMNLMPEDYSRPKTALPQSTQNANNNESYYGGFFST